MDTPPTDVHAGRRGMVGALVLVGCVLGPYLFAGVRTEQIAIYLLALTIVLTGGHITTVWKRLRTVIFAWLAYYAAIGFASIMQPTLTPVFSLYRGNAIASLDNALLPLAAVLVGASFSARHGWRHLLMSVSIGMSLNAGLAVLTALFGFQIVPRAWVTHETGDLSAVSDRAALMGRYLGVFDQPAEAGAAYAIASVAAIAVWATQRPWLCTGILLLLGVGGALSVSKVYLLSIPVVLVLLWAESHRTSLVMLLTLPTLLWLGTPLLVERWSGLPYLMRFTQDEDGLSLESITSDRFGSEQGIADTWLAIAEHDAWLGYGITGASVPYDFGPLEAYSLAGLLGVGAIAAVWVALVSRVTRMSRRGPYLALLTCLLIAFAGFPSLTANRVATLAGMMIGSAIVTLGWETIFDGRARRITGRAEGLATPST